DRAGTTLLVVKHSIANLQILGSRRFGAGADGIIEGTLPPLLHLTLLALPLFFRTSLRGCLRFLPALDLRVSDHRPGLIQWAGAPHLLLARNEPRALFEPHPQLPLTVPEDATSYVCTRTAKSGNRREDRITLLWDQTAIRVC